MTTAPRMMDSDEILLLERRCDDGMSCDDDADRLLAHIAAQATELQQLRAAKAADRERAMEAVRGVLVNFSDNMSNAIATRVADALAVPVRPALSDADRRTLVALRGFIAGIDGQRGHGNDWSAELALLDRLLAEVSP